MENHSREANTVGTREAGKMLGIKSDTVAAKCRNGVFPNARQDKTGCPWQIPVSDIEEYIAKYYKGRK